MKKFARVLYVIVMLVPMLIGAMFLSPHLADDRIYSSLNGGGRGNSLTSPNSGEDFAFEDVAELKSCEDYYTDFAVPTTKAETTLEGNGTSSDPYIVNSTSDFFYLRKYSISNKYIELACDVVLNEEVFDENGKITGSTDGGIVYDWQPVNGGTLHINGRGHSILGLHMVNAVGYGTGKYIGLFAYNNRINIGSITNLNLENVYISGKNDVSGFANRVSYMENCHLFSGYVKGSSNVSGLACNVGTINNCSNYATISGAHVAGIACNLTSAYGCENYGTIKGEGNYSSSLFDSVKTIINCVNYGNVISGYSYVGGLVTQALKGFVMKDCVNYGTISAVTRVAAFVNKLEVDGFFINCKNYGETKITKTASAGRQLYYCTSSSVNVIVSGCVFENNDKYQSLFSGEGTANSIFIDKCIINAKCNYDFTILHGATNIKVKSLEVNVLTNTVKTYLISSTLSANIEIDEVMINGGDVDYNSLSSSSPKANIQINKGIVYDSKTNKHYYGTNFTGFYIDYKTGKVLLKSSASKNLFGGNVTEETLLGKGYRKIAI